jgi:hypothetical protein
LLISKLAVMKYKNPLEDPYVIIGQITTFFYFGYILLFIPGLGVTERVLIENKIHRLNF